MDQAAAIAALERICETGRVAVLANVDPDGVPRTRWMTPCVLKEQQGSVFALTSRDFEKRAQLEANDLVEWLFTSGANDEIARVRGRAVIVENPQLQAKVAERLGSKLATFWRVSPDSSRLIVLETVIDAIVYYRPESGEKSEVAFA